MQKDTYQFPFVDGHFTCVCRRQPCRRGSWDSPRRRAECAGDGVGSPLTQRMRRGQQLRWDLSREGSDAAAASSIAENSVAPARNTMSTIITIIYRETPKKVSHYD